MNAVVFAEHPGVMTIAEESTSWPMVSRPVDHGGLGFTHKWNMGWMHDTLAYFKHDPVHRRFHHRELTFGLLYAFTENFVLPLSHDEVVHGKGSLLTKMPGDEWQRFANLRSLYGWMWAYPGGQLLFMGGEIAQWTEWSEERGVDWAALERLDAPRRAGAGAGPEPGVDHQPGHVGARPRAGRLPVARRRRRRAQRVRLPAVVGRRPPGGGLPGQLHAGAARRLPRRPAVGRRVARAARHQRAVLRRHGLRRHARGVGRRR